MLCLFIRSLVNPFLEIASTFFESSFNSFSTNTCFVLFEVIYLLNFLVYHQNLSFFTKLAISFLFAKFACANLAVKLPAVNLLNSGVVIYLLWSGILFSTAVRAVVVTKLVILGILFLTSFILGLRAVFAAKLVILGI